MRRYLFLGQLRYPGGDGHILYHPPTTNSPIGVEFQSFTDLGRSLKPEEIAQRNLVARRLIKSAHEHAEVVMDIEFFEFLSR